MSYQVLLVDDEQIYLRYLKEMIDWGELDCRICGCAKDGEEAVRLAEEKKPDIVFMDINMSQMDGLEACAALREKKNGAKVVIMTAYNEFSFAHRAIKLNVFDYLLKPFDQEELKNALRKCIQEIQKERKQEKNQRESVLKEILDCGMPTEERKQMEKEISSHYYVAVLIKRKKELPLEGRENFGKLLDYYFRPLFMESYLVGMQKGCHIIIHTMMERKIFSDRLKEIYRQLLKEHPAKEILQVAVGNVVEGIENLRKTYEDAFLVMENRIKLKDPVASWEDLQKLNKEVSLLNSGDINILIKAFEMKEYKKMDQMIERIFGLSQNQMFSFQYVIATYYSLVTGIYGHYHYNEENKLTDLMGTQTHLVSDLESCSTAGQMIEIVRNYIYEAFSDCLQVKMGNKKEILVDKIERYLQEHYPEKSLSVNQIAENLYFENSYIRRVFKVQTGETIIQRLESIRMRRAGSLLLENKYKISQIAEMTGYCDQYYFSRRFKLFYGCSPSEFTGGHWAAPEEVNQ